MIPELTLTTLGPTMINASWTAVDGATLYLILRGTNENGPFNLVGTTSNLSYIDRNLNSNTTYYYRVIPFLSTVPGEPSDIETATTQVAPTPAPVPFPTPRTIAYPCCCNYNCCWYNRFFF